MVGAWKTSGSTNSAFGPLPAVCSRVLSSELHLSPTRSGASHRGHHGRNDGFAERLERVTRHSTHRGRQFNIEPGLPVEDENDRSETRARADGTAGHDFGLWSDGTTRSPARSRHHRGPSRNHSQQGARQRHQLHRHLNRLWTERGADWPLYLASAGRILSGQQMWLFGGRTPGTARPKRAHTSSRATMSWPGSNKVLRG